MKSNNMFKMLISMTTCCLLPAAIVYIVAAFGISSDNKIIASVVPFLCPIIMIGMMLFMGRGSHGKDGHSCCHGTSDKEDKLREVE